jgi:hypothetical protein
MHAKHDQDLLIDSALKRISHLGEMLSEQTMVVGQGKCIDCRVENEETASILSIHE